MDFSVLIVLMAIKLSMPAIAQDSECFEQCSPKIIGQLIPKFFAALRKEESDGDTCLINGDAIGHGPYQISEQHYNESVKCRPSLRDGGKKFCRPHSVLNSLAILHCVRVWYASVVPDYQKTGMNQNTPVNICACFTSEK